MIGYICTPEQKDLIQGQFYTPYEFFNCVQSIDGVWFLFLSEQDKEEVFTNMQWHWILDLPEGEYVPPPAPPFPPLEN
jgi:hypothetical protein